jgi:glycosyltransferase involved in cell wall biosynthesis
LDAIKAWGLLASGIRRAHRLLIIGVQPEARAAELRAVARRLVGDESVEVLGGLPRERYLQHIAASHLAVSCSRLEAFGLPVAESLVMGAPVLASDLPSHRELMARASAGDSYPVGNVRALAAALARAIRGGRPPRLTTPPFGWGWRERARQHIDAYQAHN